MARVRVPDETEAQIIRENGMNPDSYGVEFRDADTIRLLCYATRDEVSIYNGLQEPEEVRAPDETEAQIMRENGMNPNNYCVAYREADTIVTIYYGTLDTVTIWKGDRKW